MKIRRIKDKYLIQDSSGQRFTNTWYNPPCHALWHPSKRGGGGGIIVDNLSLAKLTKANLTYPNLT